MLTRWSGMHSTASPAFTIRLTFDCPIDPQEQAGIVQLTEYVGRLKDQASRQKDAALVATEAEIRKFGAQLDQLVQRVHQRLQQVGQHIDQHVGATNSGCAFDTEDGSAEIVWHCWDQQEAMALGKLLEPVNLPNATIHLDERGVEVLGEASA